MRAETGRNGGAAIGSQPPRDAGRVLTRATVASALLLWALMQALALGPAGGRFEYPLDDVYIHLAMAEQIARGGYGVNAGEHAAAASSVIYPLLLLPFQGSELNRLLPAFWNLVGLVLAAWAFGRVLVEAGFAAPDRRRTGLALALAAPLALNLSGIAFGGMENTLHVAVTLLAVLGLWRFHLTGRIGPLLVAACLLGPLLRYEGVAVSLICAGYVFLRGRPLPGLALAAASLAPLGAFALFLRSLGLDALPSSVISKLGQGVDQGAGTIEGLMARFAENSAPVPGQVLFVMSLVWLLGALFFLRRREAGSALLALSIPALATAHLLVGKVLMQNRYESYALAFVVAMALLLARGTRMARALTVIVAVAMAMTSVHYAIVYATHGRLAPAAIFLQQGQMARFAREHLRAPVAVNDLGHVAWRNPSYVLDLVGLGNRAALEARTAADRPPGWADPLAARHGVVLAMIYEDWLSSGVGTGWVRLGALVLDRPGAGYNGGHRVAFYATAPEFAPMILERLEGFAGTLPEGAIFEFSGDATAPAREGDDDEQR